MVIYNSYVKLPEGIPNDSNPLILQSESICSNKSTKKNDWIAMAWVRMFTAACKSKGDEIHLEISDSANINAQYETY